MNVVHSGKRFSDYANTAKKTKEKIVMAKKKSIKSSPKKCAKKCPKKSCNTKTKSCKKQKDVVVSPSENRLLSVESYSFVLKKPGILTRIYRYFFPVR